MRLLPLSDMADKNSPPPCLAWEDPAHMYAVYWLLDSILALMFWVVIATAVLSWLVAFNVVNLRHPVVATIWDTLLRLTEPLLRPIRRFMPNLGGIDISPVILLLLIGFCRILLAEIFQSLRLAV